MPMPILLPPPPPSLGAVSHTSTQVTGWELVLVVVLATSVIAMLIAAAWQVVLMERSTRKGSPDDEHRARKP